MVTSVLYNWEDAVENIGYVSTVELGGHSRNNWLPQYSRTGRTQ
jgi:hypothetical protein